MQFIQHICSLLNTVIRLLVIDEPVGPRAATPFYSVDTIIASNQMDHDTPILFALTHELRLVIKQKIEESEANGLDNRCFTCAIDSTDGSSAAPKIQVDLAVAFNILQLNTCNQHSDGTRPSQQSNSLKKYEGTAHFSQLAILIYQQESGNSQRIHAHYNMVEKRRQLLFPSIE